MKKCFSETSGLLTRTSHCSPLPTVVTVREVRSKRFFTRLRVNCRTAETVTMSFFSFLPVGRMESVPSNFIMGRLKRLPSKSATLRAPSGVMSSAYHTLLRSSRRS